MYEYPSLFVTIDMGRMRERWARATLVCVYAFKLVYLLGTHIHAYTFIRFNKRPETRTEVCTDYTNGYGTVYIHKSRYKNK